MTRYTRKDAERALGRMAERKGWTLADDSWSIHDPRREGSVFLYNPHGSYVVVAEYVADSPPRDGDDRPQAYTAIRTHGVNKTVREFCEAEAFCRDMEYVPA